MTAVKAAVFGGVQRQDYFATVHHLANDRAADPNRFRLVLHRPRLDPARNNVPLVVGHHHKTPVRGREDGEQAGQDLWQHVINSQRVAEVAQDLHQCLQLRLRRGDHLQAVGGAAELDLVAAAELLGVLVVDHHDAEIGTVESDRISLGELGNFTRMKDQLDFADPNPIPLT